MAAIDKYTNLGHLRDLEVEIVAELGRKKMKLSQVLQWQPGEVLPLEKLAGEAFELRINDLPFAEVEIVVVTDLMACRLTRLVEPLRDAQVQGGSEETVEEIELVMEEDDPRQKMVYIPQGPFVMGGRDEESPNSERPSHTVYLAAYFIDPFPVVNIDYLEFVGATDYRVPVHWSRGTFPTGTGNHPVTNVTWKDAEAYAEWAGKRLPTEAEWEKAARGTDERPYPWGDRFVEGERCNSNNIIGTTTPVDEFPDGRSAYGVWDMAGNVYEWCADYYDEEYYKHSPSSNPPGPQGGQERVVRGGSYQETRASLRCTHRAGAAETYNRDNVGFRCAMDA
jgi:sulfatase modifying factor 1